jgi:hypothetical protein
MEIFVGIGMLFLSVYGFVLVANVVIGMLTGSANKCMNKYMQLIIAKFQKVLFILVCIIILLIILRALHIL